MSTRLTQFFRQEKQVDDLVWAKRLTKICKYIAILDQTKYLIPKFSETLEPFIAFIKDFLVRISD